MNSIIREKEELIDVIRGVDHNHLHFKEIVYWISEFEILANNSTAIQYGDEIYFENIKYYVKGFVELYSGYKLIHLIQK